MGYGDLFLMAVRSGMAHREARAWAVEEYDSRRTSGQLSLAIAGWPQ